MSFAFVSIFIVGICLEYGCIQVLAIPKQSCAVERWDMQPGFLRRHGLIQGNLLLATLTARLCCFLLPLPRRKRPNPDLFPISPPKCRWDFFLTVTGTLTDGQNRRELHHLHHNMLGLLTHDRGRGAQDLMAPWVRSVLNRTYMPPPLPLARV